MGWDAVLVEGVDAGDFDAEFDLTVQGFTSVVIVPVGHHSVEDFNATLLEITACRRRPPSPRFNLPRARRSPPVPDSFCIAANHRQRNGEDQEEQHLVHPVPENSRRNAV